MLLGKKPDGRGYRFPGGFIDVTDNSAETAAIREAHEETGLLLEKPNYICSRHVNDWRNTQRNVIMTFFYHFNYQFGNAQAGDDLNEVKWIPVAQLSKIKHELVEEHQKLLEEFLNYFPKYRKMQE